MEKLSSKNINMNYDDDDYLFSDDKMIDDKIYIRVHYLIFNDAQYMSKNILSTHFKLVSFTIIILLCSYHQFYFSIVTII